MYSNGLGVRGDDKVCKVRPWEWENDRKNSGMLRKFRLRERENIRKKFRYSGKFPSKGGKKSSGA
jgi:hypothetical protein